MAERIQKVLAAAGLGSRREIEGWIREGRVRVNGRPAELGERIGPSDRVHVDGRPVEAHRRAPRPCRVLLYHKPEGEVTSRSDPQGRPTIFERLPRLRGGRWIAVGRLDITTSGLILLTTDGELANRLMHPSGQVEREYAVRVLGAVDAGMIRRLTTGVMLEDGPGRFDQLLEAGGEGANRWYHVTLREGRNREVRRLWESQGVTVSRLIRVRYGPLALPRGLRQGRWIEADTEQLRLLAEAVGLPHEAQARPRSSRPPRRRRVPRPRS